MAKASPLRPGNHQTISFATSFSKSWRNLSRHRFRLISSSSRVIALLAAATNGIDSIPLSVRFLRGRFATTATRPNYGKSWRAKNSQVLGLREMLEDYYYVLARKDHSQQHDSLDSHTLRSRLAISVEAHLVCCYYSYYKYQHGLILNLS